MKLVYICSPYRGNVWENTRAAQQYCRDAYEHNCIPVAPHLYLPQFLDDDIPTERDLALRIGLRLIDYCNEVWVHGDNISIGMKGEIEYAQVTGKPIVYLPGKAPTQTTTNPSDLRRLVEATLKDAEREAAAQESIVDEEAAISDLYW